MGKFLSIVLALLMLAVMLPITAMAAEGETTEQPTESSFEWVDDLRGMGHIIFYEDGSESGLQSHTFGDDNKCTACHYLNHEHRLTWKHEVNDGLVNVHTGHCEICGMYVTKACTYEGTGTICTACGFDKNHKHAPEDGFNFVWAINGIGYHNGTCSTCGWFYEPHTWNGDVCTICGYNKTACAHSTMVFQPKTDIVEGAVHFGYCDACRTSIWGKHNTEGSNGTCSVCGYPQSTQPEEPTTETICLHACNNCGGCTAASACNGKACTCAVKNAPTATPVSGVKTEEVLGEHVSLVVNEIKNAAKVTENIKATASSSIPAGLTLESVAAVFDIHLEMSGEIVPAGNPVTVTLPVGTDCAKAISEGKMVFIHFGESGNTVYTADGKNGTTRLTVDLTAGNITFTTNGFSPFALLSVSTPSSEQPQVTIIIGSDETDDQKNPATGANDMVAVAAALMAVSALGLAVLTRKK